MTETLSLDRELRHPPEKVWRALTQAPLIADWLMQSDFVAEVGHKFTFRSQPNPQWDGVIRAEVLAAEPPVRLAYSWESMGLDTVVTWTLTPTATGTHLRMEQSGFPDDKGPYYQGATYGWQMFLGKLEGVLEGLPA
jgi:uncharacterized protein YndB with AHSA1/START domain